MDNNEINLQGEHEKVFPSRLRKLMDDGHISQQKLADYLGLKNRQSVAGYCTGRSTPDLESIVKIASFFNVSTDYLLGLTDDPDPSPSAVDELGLADEAVRYLRALYELSKIPPHKTNHLSLLSDLLRDRRFDGLLTKFVWYVDLKSRKTDNSFWGTPEYDLCKETLMAHGYAVSTPEVQANALFSEMIIPELRELLTNIADDDFKIALTPSQLKNMKIPSIRRDDIPHEE